jgi:signal transduction histidine kinase
MVVNGVCIYFSVDNYCHYNVESKKRDTVLIIWRKNMPDELHSLMMMQESVFKKLLDVLYKISSEIQDKLDVDDLLKSIVIGIRQLGFDRAGIWLLSETGDMLHGSWGTDENGHLIDERNRELTLESLPPSHGYSIRITGESPKDKLKTDITGDIFVPKGQEDRFEEIWGSKPSYPGYYAYTYKGDNISLPILISGKHIGAVGVDNFITGRRISKENADILAMFTANLGIILHNARLVAELQNQKELERQIAQIQKMSDLGQLIASVAHELSNPLTGVIGYSELLLSTKSDKKTERVFNIINSEAQRCYKIVEGLLNFSRRYEPKREYIQINDLLDLTLNLKRYQLRLDNIELETNYSAHIPKIMADPHQMQQVFMNIINNAHQAMMNKDHDKLIVGTQFKDDNIHISFHDSGPGIPRENLDKIFQPFFTTKKEGKGTGLGLSICKSIVEEHDGKISVKSKLGQGTTFTVNLPVTMEKAVLTIEKKDEKADTEKYESGFRILVVDDEQGILDLFTDLLDAFGHKVFTAKNGNQAMEKLEEGKYDLIISDIKMPEFDGEELYNLIKSKNPELAERIIFITGDIVSSETQKFLQSTGNLYISKPFSIDEIKKAITKIGS